MNLIKLSSKIEVKTDIQHSNGAICLVKSYNDRNNMLGIQLKWSKKRFGLLFNYTNTARLGIYVDFCNILDLPSSEEEAASQALLSPTARWRT